MAGDPLDGVVTDNQHKKHDPDQPIHRINSPSFNSGQFSRADGDGIGRGCRTGGLKVVVPAWVPVQDDAFKEVEGLLARSFQTWTDFPLAQWHSWYDWNFHVVPSQPYAYLRGEGNEAAAGPLTPVVEGEAMECEWDTGAFGTAPGPMFGHDWAWPMAGQFVWIAGRWIYDCGHANARNKMRSELHPCAAVASARWEALKFDAAAKVLFPVPSALGIETPFMPGVQFAFFASRLGGYVTVPGVFERDYEFIVDLPRETAGRAVVPIGATPDHAMNTVSLGPLRIVAAIDFSPFSNAAGSKNTAVQPILEVIVPPDGSFPSQVKIKIPLSGIKGSADAYGVMISFGLVDQFLDLRKRVLLVEGSFDTVTFFNHASEHVALKFWINGRWHRKTFDKVVVGKPLPLQEKFSFALAMDHPPNGGGHLRLSSHGKVRKKVGKLLEEPLTARVLRDGNNPNSRPLQWEFDMVNPPQANNKVTPGDVELAAADRMAGTLNLFPALLGVPGLVTAVVLGLIKDANVALGVSDFVRRAAFLGEDTKAFTLEGRELFEDDKLAEIFFKSPPKTDYRISGTITGRAQKDK